MGRIADMVRGFFASTRQEEVVAEYVIREHHSGRTMEEILADTYITNRLTPEQIRRLLDREDIIKAVGDDVVAAHRAPDA